MLTKYISVDVLLCNIKMLCQSTAKSCCIQDRTGTNNLILRQSGNFCEYISHDINRIAYDYIESIWCLFNNFRCNIFENIYICLCQLNTCLTWFSCNTGGDDNDIGIFRILIFTCFDIDRVAEAGSLDNIHNFSCYFFFIDINQNDLRCDILIR